MYPIINHINDVLPAIEGRKEFSVKEKDGYTVINYNVVMEDTFPTPNTKDEDLNNLYRLRRECRGIIFDSETGLLLRRPWHKFFNINERPETSNIDMSQEHVMLDKLDGSMISPFVVDNEVIWGSKAGDGTEVSNQVIKYLHDSTLLDYYNYIIFTYYDYTFLFEWCSPNSRIVIPYEEENLVLCGIRHNLTGQYYNFEVLKGHFSSLFPVVKQYEGMTLDAIKTLEGEEGRVLVFDHGMYKTKSDWYLQLHKGKEYLQFEKYMWQMVLNDTIDDFIPLMKDFVPSEKIYRFESDLWEAIHSIADELTWVVIEAKDNLNCSKKKFALEYIPKFSKAKAGLLFSIWDDNNPFDVVKDYIQRNTTTAAKLEQAKAMLNNEVEWKI